jgi:hypothetical protein
MSKKASAKSKAKYNNSNKEDFEDNEGNEPPLKNHATAKKATSSKALTGCSYDDSDIEFLGSTKSQAPSKPAASSTQTARTTAKKSKYNYDDDSEVEEIDDSNIKETP